MSLPPLVKPLAQIWGIASRRPPVVWPKKFGGGGGDVLNEAVDAVSLLLPNSLAFVFQQPDLSQGDDDDFQLLQFTKQGGGGGGRRFPVNWTVQQCLQAHDAESIREEMYFVCAHGTRDKRCGDKGPPIVEELRTKGKKVFACSHLGGHKFAGNVLVLPSARWFSLVEAGSNAHQIVLEGEAAWSTGQPFCRGCSW